MLVSERVAFAAMVAGTALLSRRARQIRALASTERHFCGTDQLLVIADFDLTLTAGGSSQCHDVLAKSPHMPPSLLAAFEPMLDFSKPMPPHLNGNGWWVQANEILLSHGSPRRDVLPKLVTDAAIKVRPGAAELLQLLARRDVPVLIVSAGFADVIEEFLRSQGLATPNVRVSSNRLRWDDSGALCAVEPTPPITSLNKAETAQRNAAFFVTHADRRRLLVLGDRLSDLDSARGVECDERFTVGIINDTPEIDASTPADYQRAFDMVLRGSDASLAPVTAMLEGR